MTGEQRVGAPDSGVARGRHGQLVGWGVVGVIAQGAFIAGWLVAESWQGPRYNPLQDSISDLQAATAPHVWFPIACFALGGLGTFGFAVFGLRPALGAAGKVAAHAPWLLAVSALALGNSFPLIPCRLSDPGCNAHHQLFSAGGMTDAIVSGVAFAFLVITPFPMWRRLAVLPQWRRLKPVMMAARIVGPICFILLAATSGNGFTERLLVTVCVLWVLALAVNLIRTTRHPFHAEDQPSART
jgi:hypothetical membrane protein